MKRFTVGLAMALGLAFLLLPTVGSQTLICTPLASPTPTPSPTSLPPGEPYTFQTTIDLVPPEPRLWYALQTAGSVWNAWTTYGLADSIIPAQEGNPSTTWQAYCNMPATGCSASTAATDLIDFQSASSPAYSVLWRLVWYPRSSVSDVKLVLMDSGFANPITLYSTENEVKTNNSYTTGAYVTEAWNAAAALRQVKYLGMMTRGNGSIGPAIFQSRVTLVHSIPR